MNKKRFNPQRNISFSGSLDHEPVTTQQHAVDKKEKHFEVAIKNISHSYHKQKKSNTVKNTIFFTVLSLFLLSTAAWALPRVLSLQLDSVSSFFSEINPIEVLAPENNEMNVLIL